jgi:hypothetical protein
MESLEEEEIKEVLKKMKRGKAPGIDGFSVKLYKSSKLLTKTLIRMWKEVRTGENPPLSLGIRVIKIIPKEGDKIEMKNYRPITLLNIDYKIIAKVYDMRLNSTLSRFINKQQKGEDILEITL